MAVISAATVPVREFSSKDVWRDGYLVLVYEFIFRGWGGLCIVVVSVVDNISSYLVAISTTSRVIMKMADDGRNDETNQNKIAMLPVIFSYEWRRTSSPIVAVILQSMVIMFLIQFDFTLLVEVDSFANAISLMLEFAAFIRLRYTEPDALRPYKVPGGMAVAWGITIIKLILVMAITVLMFSEWKPFVCIVGFNVVITILYLVRVFVKNLENSDYILIGG